MPTARKIKTNPPDREWRRLLNERGFTRKYRFENSTLEPLKHLLLDIGGWAVCLPMKDVDSPHIISRGRRFPGRSISIPGAPSQCHTNSVVLWKLSKEKKLERHQDIRICSGYALSKDGVWRQHSWCAFEEESKIRLIETTVKRVQYFGYILTDEEAMGFFSQLLI